MPTDTQPVQHLTADDLAARLGIPKWSVYDLVKQGQLPALRIGRRVRFRLADVEQWEAQRVEQHTTSKEEKP